jgi:hypothetical protein
VQAIAKLQRYLRSPAAAANARGRYISNRRNVPNVSNVSNDPNDPNDP